MKQLSKKDIAFEKERVKFRQEIRNLTKENKDKEETLNNLLQENKKLENKIEEQKDWIERLLDYCNLSEDEFKRMKDINDVSNQLSDINNVIGKVLASCFR